ncbi:hypothetical protein BDV36DRAFT_94315 [Aspergillus pseudocaelatus]|uniref:Uncharacterized protein n=1 Tax=Aspergillus pseudocaelatus TaxID=1825620 RepID=A0ABQ6X2V1_9EURO|nr:hypothetical protein BDV36DRAFT_94315 [Aspergillus pseudocaelatus]
MMSSIPVGPEAVQHLKELSKWLRTAEMKSAETNMLRCVDEGRHEALRPLLKCLGINAVKVRKRKSLIFLKFELKALGPWLYNVAYIWENINSKIPGLRIPLLPLVRRNRRGPHRNKGSRRAPYTRKLYLYYRYNRFGRTLGLPYYSPTREKSIKRWKR